MSPILILHAGAGTIAMLSGLVAVSVAKGSRPHQIFGTVFFAAMLTMSAMGAWLAVPLQQWGNVIGGLFAFYLVATAWMTVRRREGTVGLFEVIAMLVAFAGAAVILYFGFKVVADPKAVAGNGPVAAYFVLAGIFALCGALDLKVILGGGISGRPRIARHLWRMCFAFAAAFASFYAQVFLRKVHLPAFLHHSPLLYIPILAPFLLIPFWLVRVRLTKWYRQDPAAPPPGALHSGAA
jgi:hypothetical protein